MTAVEWYIENVKLTEIKYLDDKITTKELDIIINNIGDQAKEMERRQQEYFINCGRQYQLTGEGTFTKVYNETFKK